MLCNSNDFKLVITTITGYPQGLVPFKVSTSCAFLEKMSRVFNKKSAKFEVERHSALLEYYFLSSISLD